MAEITNISWCDRTWSPWFGCTQVSLGDQGACVGCYAMNLHQDRFHRVIFGGPGRGEGTRDAKAESGWLEPLKWEREQARAWAEFKMCFEGEAPGMIPPAPCFVFPSMCDPFDNHPALPELRRRFFNLIRATPHLTWLLLTKRPGNIVKLWEEAQAYNPDFTLEEWPRNAAIGCTVVTQDEADRDIPKLLAAKAALNPAFAFVSMEPLLGPVDISRYLGENWADGRDQEQRGVRLSGSPERRTGDHARRHDLAAEEAGLESLDRDDRDAAMQEGARGASIRSERGIPAGRSDAGWQAGVRAGAPTGLAPLQGADPRGHDGQPSGRPEEAQPARQPGARDPLGTAASSGPRPRARSAQEPGLSWVIAGGETDQGSHRARPVHPDWLRSLRDQCEAAATPFHLKQLGEWAPDPELDRPFISHGGHAELGTVSPLLSSRGQYAVAWTHRSEPKGSITEGIQLKRVGKKAAGRLLDGVIHDARPEVRA